MALSSIRHFYLTHHVNAPQAGVRDKRSPTRAFDLVASYLAGNLRDDGVAGAPKVGHFTLARQEGFMRWCRDEVRLSGKTISTYLSYIKAGLRFASRPHLVEDSRGRAREVMLLSSLPYVEDGEDKVSRVTSLPRSQPREWIPTDAELAALIGGLPEDQAHEGAFRYIILALNTWARPEAICELSVKRQVDFARGLVHLNPPGRAQNKKVRPTIRLTENLRGWLEHWGADFPVAYFGRPVLKVDARTLKRPRRLPGSILRRSTATPCGTSWRRGCGACLAYPSAGKSALLGWGTWTRTTALHRRGTKASTRTTC